MSPLHLPNRFEATLRGVRAESLAAIPCLNEAPTVGDIVQGALDYVDAVVVVDDGSSDETFRRARDEGAIVLRHPRTLGYGRALQTCFDAAASLRTDGLVLLDGDGQHLPGDVPRVLNPVLEGAADLCIGSRFLPDGTQVVIPADRAIGIQVVTWVANALMRFPRPLTDAQSGFRAFTPSAFRRLRIQTRGMGASTEVLWQARHLGLRIAEVPVSCLYRSPEHSIHPVRQGAQVLWTTFVAPLWSFNGSSAPGSGDLRPPHVHPAAQEVSPREQGGRLEGPERSQ